jgi:hypothetical protein
MQVRTAGLTNLNQDRARQTNSKLGQGEVDMQTKRYGSTAMYGTLQCEMFHEKTGLEHFFVFTVFKHCFICRRSYDSTVPEDAGIEPRTVMTLTLAVARSNHSARSHPLTLLGWFSSQCCQSI